MPKKVMLSATMNLNQFVSLCSMFAHLKPILDCGMMYRVLFEFINHYYATLISKAYKL